MTATTSPSATDTVDLRTPGQLLAALPHLLGFHPAGSVLVLGHQSPDGNRIGNVLRADLPPPGNAQDLALQLCTPLAGDGSVAVTIAVVGGQEQATGPPYGDVVDVLRNVFVTEGLKIAHALWAPEIRAGATWRCYVDSTCRGTLPDPGSTVMAAVAAHAGVVTYRSREAMARQLAPPDEDALARRAAMINAALDEATEAHASGSPDETDETDEIYEIGETDEIDETDGAGNSCATGDPDPVVEQALALVRSALERIARLGPEENLDLSDDDVVSLALALSLPEVRDPCLATSVPVGTRRAAFAERLWLALVRATPAPERAQPACLLAYSAYVRGEGALAGMALENALEADPGHVLAGLLKRALEHALAPAVISQLARTCDDSPLWRAGEVLPRPSRLVAPMPGSTSDGLG